MRTRYWFKPKRMGEFAAYYPVNFPGWMVTLSCLFFLLYFFVIDTEASYSLPNGLFHFFLEAVIVLLVYDLFCFRVGEYPSWWRGHKWRHKVHRHHPENRAHREARKADNN